MKNDWTRRRWLQTLPIGCGVLANVKSSCPNLVWQNAGTWTEPLRLSLAAYSYRQPLEGNSPAMSLFDFVDECARLGLTGAELTSYYFPQPVTLEFVRRLKAHCFRAGIDVSGTAIGNDFGHLPGPRRDEQLALTRRWIEFAEMLGAPVIRVFAGNVPEGVLPDAALDGMISGLQEACEFAGRHGVHLALENHGGPTSTVEGLLEIHRAVNSPWLGINLDTGNFHSADVYGDLERVASLAINVQVKVTVTEQGQKKPTDFGRVAAILQAAKYRGYVVLEYEEADDPRIACPRYIDQLRQALATPQSNPGKG